MTHETYSLVGHSLLVAIIALALASASFAQSGPPTCGSSPVTLNAYFETGFDLPFKLSDEFTKQFPNVKWDIKQD